MGCLYDTMNDKFSNITIRLSFTEIRKLKLIYPYYRIYASVNRVNIGSDNGLSPIRRQAII